nr:MAG: ORF1 [Torque teno midi virus]
MPFWWRRRRKFWWYNQRRNKRRRPYRRRRKRFTRRQRYRRAPYRRRKRRRRYKVRRKKKKIPIAQWQPDSIVKCKIQGQGILVLGSEGTQMTCYTYVKENFTPPKIPGGGGFGSEVFSLQYLYEEYVFRRNIWTKTNILKDLCRYLHCKFYFYRHLTTDFIVNYQRQPPFHLEKHTYTAIHPQQMLLQRHKKILYSAQTNPKGKLRIKFNIKPPKQMLTKWFFTDHFCNYPLVHIQATAASFAYSNLSPTAVSQLINILYINQSFYKYTNWGNTMAGTVGYTPYDNVPATLYYKNAKGQKKTYTKQNGYYASVDYTTGWFNSDFLSATGFYDSTYTTKNATATPLSICRYNPTTDDGKHNALWLVSIVKNQPVKPTTDPVLVYEGLPMWLMLFGYLSYVLQTKKDKTFLETYFIVLQSPSFHMYQTTQTVPTIIPIDTAFTVGQGPYDSYLTETEKKLWYPTLKHQMVALNSIVESGPLIPKLGNERLSNWELDYSYIFYFKWGGPEISDQPVADPSKQPDYDVPDHLTKAVQITNPSKQTPQSYAHAWDYRRGFLTKPALKRMFENIQTDTDFEPDTDTQPQKKKRKTALLKVPQQEEEIQSCLRYLCEENTFQETPQNIQQLIEQQRLQQQELKFNILKLLSDLKARQQAIQLQTGLFE